QNQTPILSPGKKITFERSKKSYPSNQEIATEADKIAKAFEDLNWFSGVVMVARDGKPVFEKAYGLADIEKGIKNTPGTKFRIGSINKSYTSVLISQMVEKGKLSYDDKLSKFDLGFPAAVADKVNIRQILTHSAGFADIFIPKYLDNIRDYKTIDDILPLLMNEPLIYEPGKNRQYSNYGYIVLGAILEKISGKPFGELLQENILDVISAKDTHYDIAENIEGEAQSYLFTLTGEKTDYTSRLEYCTPDGGMYSTTHDLLTYYQALFYTEKLLSDKTKAMQVFQYQPGKRKWKDILPSIGTIGEAGGGPGVSALAEMNISDNIMVFVLANTDRQAAEEVGLRIMSFIEGHGYEPPQLPPALFAWKLIQKYDQPTLVKEFQNKFKENGYHEYHSGILNRLGYDLMNEEKYQEAIQVLTLNTELFPKEANPYDSLGEAYYKSGDRENARKYYQKALEIDPDLPSAREMMGKLK
ncbi:MAG: serine hydrolase, partial [Bacteroidetes bacterium]|nr:serine hydrolase [Bacteroidota bacterium]